MQIKPTVPRPSASVALGAPTETSGAGFASLLRQRMPTPEPTLATRAPAKAAVPTPPAQSPAAKTAAAPTTAAAAASAASAASAAPAAPAAPTAAAAATPATSPAAAAAPTPAAAPTAAAALTPAEALTAAAALTPAAALTTTVTPTSPTPAPTSAEAPQGAETASADGAGPALAPDLPAASDPGSTPAPSAAPTAAAAAAAADAALRSQLRVRLRAVEAAMTNTRAAGDALAAEAMPTVALEPAEAADTADKADAAPATHPIPDASALPAPFDPSAAALQPPPPPAAPPADASRATAAPTARPDARIGPAAMRGDVAATTGAPRVDDSTANPDPARPAAPPNDAFASLLALQQPGKAADEPARTSALDANLPNAVGAAAFRAAPVPGLPTPQPVAIATPVDAPDFAQQLGVQLSVLTKDGVHRAELHLNPADMGPVSVQITMDGTQARIDFGADVAATRHAIEAGLPQLAGALADAGFTLAGGGVSSHAGGRGDGGGGRQPPGSGNAPTRATGNAVTESAAPATRRVVSMGGLDLYA